MKRIISVIVGFLIVSLLSVTSRSVFASSGNWNEVTRFTDEGMIFTTEPFTIDHVEWRIRWEYEPQPEIPEEHASLQFYVYAQEDYGSYFESISKKGSEETSGTLYIHDKNGTFYLFIISAVQNYTLIIEQDLESIPEFSSWIPMLVMVLGVTVIGAVYKTRIKLRMA